MKTLIILVDKKQKNLGGQERRWIRVVNYMVENKNYNIDFVINRISFDLSQSTDASASVKALKINDCKINIIDYFKKNIYLFFLSTRYNRIHFSNQSIYLIPAILLIKLILRKNVSFSYNGTSLKVHKTKNFLSYYNKVKIIHKVTDKIEILNPRLYDENWLINNKTYLAPCSFSDQFLFYPKQKKKKIVFSGHFYEGKGILLLKKLLETSSNKGFEMSIYGDSIPGDKKSEDFKEWLINFTISNKHVQLSHQNNMAGAYEDCSVFLSLQVISNYPSQSVIEALYSGCSILMTNTGDSNKFGNFEYIKYFSESENIDIIWNLITELDKISNCLYKQISESSKFSHSSANYFSFIKDFLK